MANLTAPTVQCTTVAVAAAVDVSTLAAVTM